MAEAEAGLHLLELVVEELQDILRIKLASSTRKRLLGLARLDEASQVAFLLGQHGGLGLLEGAFDRSTLNQEFLALADHA
eukprot:CAMPEP_0170498816 /NCGR_PEP_ID=MMETSP0208-20121228/29078_1 /TAXON_ID=197538 /ORGANISM="Strombidium inclinatum, Strain S3" /LENGTH=79 /DNA_ID=CAMNT_0010776107 /DNA_START=2363 /DNA_END=2602 /DNA_ORIENTATION=+